LNADEKKLFSRMAEVFAGYSEYTDVQIGRIIDYLEQSGQLDNTIVFYAADNGTSGEGTALPDRLGSCVLDPIPDVQALLAVFRRHRGPAGHFLAQGH
jgi:arylsulfatase A-like enzyme